MQIAPLVSFGQLLIEEDVLLPQLTGFSSITHHGYQNIAAPNAIYGIRDNLSVYFAVPVNIRSKTYSSRSSGFNDLILQLEYGYVNWAERDSSLQATLVGNIQFPTGSSSKNPPNGAGWFSYFAGTTLSYMTYDWYAFVSPGANLTISHQGTKFGNSYLYQFGLARYIEFLSPRGWIFDLMIEIDGTFMERNEVDGAADPDSGGNVILATPSIWLSSDNWFFQWGISVPIFQNLNGTQDSLEYSVDYNLGVAIRF
ncbi:MAG: hypothetical protein JSS32_00395 [Verrucomicrobia bacterium]|nr:hypothetical protein [Verrucomicrobiota bacterium]